MGSCQTKEKSSSSTTTRRSGGETEAVVMGLKNKVILLQQEINEIMCIRETENQIYERELMAFAFKQAHWNRENKSLKDELIKLRNTLAHKEETLINITSCINNNSNNLEDQTAIRRDETVDKWKKLYFAIKNELDHLIIQTTHQEERVMCWNIADEEEVLLVEMTNELKAKEERIEFLQNKLVSMELQESKREREIDILRQSLRIMSHNNKRF
ncbi:hypothetical protein ABFS82_14G030900 [Erythranthe guttata]|uniref:uncharacterized protein LOC105963080 isoform X2 n=1 Tax=Erythranthe guttata TaxID=4155 RepID=UPI00064DA32B|nr:PREDICTED: uncharacterized protein LOC105963080 isoform X2 [Erythranthe guttata]|eukprot:XP_012842903.1 PREDICTED: uncharacterized protein LOC105963080 isoform X2 [Erythranthe guttata]